jgi:ATP-binding cassette subfamily B protein
MFAVLRSALQMCWHADRVAMGSSLALQAAAGVGTAAQLLLARRLLEQVVQPGDDLIERAAPWLIALVLTTAALGLVVVVQATLSMVLTEAVAVEAMGRILDVAARTELIVWEDPTFHDRLERARTNAASRPVMAVNGLLGLISGFAGAVGVAIALLAIDPVLVPLAALGAVPAWFAATANSRGYHRFTKEQTPDDRRRSYLMHVLTNRDLVKELRVYGMEPELRDRHDALHRSRVEQVRHLARRRRGVSAVAAIGTAVLSAVAIGYLLVAIDRGRLDLASAGTALFSLLFLAQRLRAMAASASTLYEAGLFLDEITEFEAVVSDLAVEATPDPRSEASAPLPPFSRLTGTALRFAYPAGERDAVAGVDVEVGRGEVVALVGENGSGKTTLAKLLAGNYVPTGGTLAWNDHELAPQDLARLRRSVAVVFQDYARLQLTAADNIGLGDPARLGDRAAIERAGSLAGADEVVAGFADGWDQQLGHLFDRGVDLSGGQWQRMALGRALFRDASFVILDEPSSALDPRAEAALLDRMRSLVDGRGVLFISHRFSTVRMADRIYVMESGRVVEVGTHDDLMAGDGLYADLYRLQAASYIR